MEKFSSSDIIAIIKTLSRNIILIIFCLFLFSGIALVVIRFLFPSHVQYCINVPLFKYCQQKFPY